MDVSRRRVGWLAGIATVVTLAGLACKDSASPVPAPRMDEVPCAGECPSNDSTPVFYAAPSLYSLNNCFIQEGDGATDVIAQNCGGAFDGSDRQFTVSYIPLVEGSPAVSAIYELTYSDTVHYVARFLDVQFYNGHDRVSHTVTVHFDPNAAGIRVRSYTDVCNTPITTALACFRGTQGGHDELHICIPNTSAFGDPVNVCQDHDARYNGNTAPIPHAGFNIGYYDDPWVPDVAFGTVDGRWSNRTPETFHWQRRVDSWSQSPAVPGATCDQGSWNDYGSSQPTVTVGWSGLAWVGSVRVRLRVADSVFGTSFARDTVVSGVSCN